jgi:serine/threonine protein kinase
MTPDGPSPADSLGDSPREQRLGELVNEFFDAAERGENPSQEEFLARYPEYAEELREHLGGLDLLAGLATPSSNRTRSGRTPIPKGSSAANALADGRPLPAIPGYDVHKQIGRGGMGIVYKAMQLSTKRLVALKLLLEGPFASDGSRKRFEREIALAAQLRHPNIIPIYDSGVSDGRMFYAMEHIYGLALGDHVRAHNPDIKARLRLFAKICSAVGHAHLRGVIHRDLKPSNILVDGAGEPHILDFGLAKAGTFGDMSTSLTAQIIGTPAYMSPEQAAGDPAGIDTRTDVYSLGVILFEMLTGAMPYETNVAMGKILHNIAHAEPEAPGRVNPKIDVDLSTIVLKALEKNKDTRYQSIDSFVSDVQHYLADEPISVRPPSGTYLLKKLIYKHRMAVGLCSILVLLTGGGLLAIRQYSKKIALEQKELNEQLQQRAEEARQLQAQLQSKKAAEEENRRQRELAQLDLILRNMDPQMRKSWEPILRQAPGLATGEAAIPTLAELTQRLVAGISAGEVPPIPKSTQVDLSDLTRAKSVTEPKPSESKASLDEAARMVDEAARGFAAAYRQYQEAAMAAATSQPATAPAATTSPSD